MSESRQILETIINDFSVDKFSRFFREKNRNFVVREENYTRYDDDNFKDGLKIGEINFSEIEKIIVCSFKVKNSLSERSGKRAQYEKAKNILKSNENRIFSAGIFIFYDKDGHFRFSLVYPESIGTKRQWSHFKRFTYFVNKELTNKTFLKQIGEKKIESVDEIKEAFSISAVTNLFYDDFFKIYDTIIQETKKINDIDDDNLSREFVLLFAIRTIFLGFIQKRKWLGGDEKFIENFYREYSSSNKKNEFYSNWLCPLFFEALNSSPGHKVEYGKNNFSKETELKLQMAPFLNGGLFKEKRGYDNNGWIIPDEQIKSFFEFLFSHSFTIEENALDDEDLQLNPEFLGIIFERLVNKADGAVYTQRMEVDIMCRWSLIKWLEKNLDSSISKKNLYELFFRESGEDEDEKKGSFSKKEAMMILEKLEQLSICDPAAGSGAFLVGMMQVLDEVEQSLKERYGLNGRNVFERKKQIIKNSLYGVEAKEWAVWICQLRLWLSLFIDTPEEMKNSMEAILPSLDFKVRRGDSLVQRVGSKSFPVAGRNLSLSTNNKIKITKLRKYKIDYFDNKIKLLKNDFDVCAHRELSIYESIIDEEIKTKKDEIKKEKNIKISETMTLLPSLGYLQEQQQATLQLDNKEKIERLEKEIKDLLEQKELLKKGKPLVWNIEFADIFWGDKKGFDIVIGNPPYVRQESIEDPMGKVKDKKEYKKYLQEMVRLDFPNDFPPKKKINAQSDLYTYFYIRGLKILNSQGVHAFICSNSWLDVGYGTWLQEFLLKRCPVDLIIDNHAKRSFGAADVNTIISIIHAPQKKVDENHLVKFTAFKKPFEKVIFTNNLLEIEEAKQVLNNENFRVYPISIKDLKEAGTEYEDKTLVKTGKYVGDKWGGKYLRAPDIFFTILEKGKDKLVKLRDVADVRFGIKTGANDFFYLTKSKAKEWGIEEEFLKPVIKSPRECKSILVNPKDLKYKIFMCNKSKEELKGTNALKYIEWGEVKGFDERPSCGSRRMWWNLGLVDSKIVYPSTYNPVFKIFFNTEKYPVDKVFYGIESNKPENLIVSVVSYLFTLQTEVYGYALVGGGGLFMTVENLGRILVFYDKKIKNDPSVYSKIRKSIFEECGIDPKSEIPIEEQEPNPLPDRAELDKIVFDALGLTTEERKEVYRAVCRLVWNRISKAKSV